MSKLGLKAAVGCLAWISAVSAFAAEPRAPGLRLPDHAQVNVSPEQLLRALASKDQGEWKPSVNQVRTRGPGAFVYTKAAPAVVAVRTGKGHEPDLCELRQGRQQFWQ